MSHYQAYRVGLVIGTCMALELHARVAIHSSGLPLPIYPTLKSGNHAPSESIIPWLP